MTYTLPPAPEVAEGYRVTCGIDGGSKTGSGAPPAGILDALSKADSAAATVPGQDWGAAYNSFSGLCFMSRGGFSIYVNPDPTKLPIKAATVYVKGSGDNMSDLQPAWRFWWATHRLETGGNRWWTPLLAPASAIIPARHYATSELFPVPLMNLGYCVPRNWRVGWTSYVCLAAVIQSEAAAMPTTNGNDWRMKIGTPLLIDLWHDPAMQVILVTPGPATTRNGVGGVGQRSR